MSAEDRLAAQREAIRDQTEEPIDLRELQSSILRFGAMLIDSGKLNDHVRSAVQGAVYGVCGTPQFRFQAAYEKEYLKAAYLLVGIYESLFGGQ